VGVVEEVVDKTVSRLLLREIKNEDSPQKRERERERDIKGERDREREGERGRWGKRE